MSLEAGSVEGFLPGGFHRVQPRSIEVPYRVVAEELAAGPAEHRPIGLAANLVRCGFVLTFVGGLDENEGADRAALVLGLDRPGTMSSRSCTPS